jgi:hypothetical protein
MGKVPEPDFDEVFSLYEQDPEDVARAVINAPADEELDRAEFEEPTESI